MAIAWSRISSKVIATPPDADEAVRVRARDCRDLLGALVPQMVGNGKREIWERKHPTRSRHGHPPPGLGLPASGVEAKPDSTGLLLAPGYVGLLASGWWRRQRAV